MYILFPIGIMYYFGTNLDKKFTVPDFWPRPEQTNKIPYEREDIAEELERLKARRLERRQMRLQAEARMQEFQRPPLNDQVAQPASDVEQPARRGIMSYFRSSKSDSS